MSDHLIFEMLSFAPDSVGLAESAGDNDWSALPWQDDQRPSASVLQFTAGEQLQDGATWVGVDKDTGAPCLASCKQDAVAGFAVVDRRLGSALSMTTPNDIGVLVNGLPALDFTVLSPRDSVVLTPGVHSYITERVRPYVGKPLAEMIGTKCPFCKIPVTEDTQIVTCRCGVIYHHEISESHPDIEEKDRLNCFSRLSVCLSCSRPVTLQEYLVWDPRNL